MQATRTVQLLEQSLRDLQRQGAEPKALQDVQERLTIAQAELAALGDCGD
jgi:hypothetical protein